MPTSSVNEKLDRLCRTARLTDDGEETDGRLLGDFVSRHDEVAFASLVRRHGPMVLGVCRRSLGHWQDAEDALQATFIVLARKAATIRPREQLGNWLYGVAYRTALEARRLAVRRRAKESQVENMPDPAVKPEEPWHDLRAVLDEELNRLPAKFRLPIVLCDLEGRTRKEVARQLGLPDGTLSNRLAAARRRLAKRLTRRGVTLSASAMAVGLSQLGVSARVPAALANATTRAAIDMALTGSATASASANVAALTKGVLDQMFLTKLKHATAALFVLGLLGIGFCASLRDYRSHGAESPHEPPAPPPKEAPAQNNVAVPERPGDGKTTIVERGTLEPVVVTDVVCGLKTSTVQWVVEDGTKVKKGDRLVALDDARLREQLREHGVAFDQAVLAKATAAATLNRIRKENQLEQRAGEIEVKLASLELQKYSGNDPIDKEILELKVKQAQVALERSQLRGQANEAQAKLDLDAKTAVLDQDGARKRNVEAQLARCVLVAPHDGIAVHYFPSSSPRGLAVPLVAEGEPVREGQRLVRVCSEDRFLVLIHVPEAHVTRLRAGQSAEVRIDAYPDRVLRGTIKRVSNVASPQGRPASDVKVYPVEVELADKLAGLKPGMTARAGIETDRTGGPKKE